MHQTTMLLIVLMLVLVGCGPNDVSQGIPVTVIVRQTVIAKETVLVMVTATSVPPAPRPSSATPEVSSTPKTTDTPRPTNTPVPTASPKPLSDLTFAMIRAKHQALTDVQWQAYAATLRGLRVRWSGWVFEAQDTSLRGPELMIDVDPPSPSGTQDCFVPVPKADILKYNRGQLVTWEGDIESVSVHPILSVVVEFAKGAIVR
jgi:hypothetical protein